MYIHKVNRKNKLQFVESDFQNKIAFQIYSNSSLEFYKNEDGYYMALNSHEIPFYIGNNIANVEACLLEYK